MLCIFLSRRRMHQTSCAFVQSGAGGGVLACCRISSPQPAERRDTIMPLLKRRSLLAGAAATLAAPALIRPAWAADTVKIGCLFSSSGTMANLEGRLNYITQMAADEINASGGV